MSTPQPLSPALLAVLERDAPQDLDAEKAVLGCLMLAGALSLEDAQATLKDVEHGIGPADFRQKPHGRILAAVSAIIGRGECPHILAVMGELENRGELDYCGGRSYLTSLAHDPPNATMVGQFVSTVKERSLQRRFAVACYSLGQRAMDRGDVTELLAAAAEIGNWPGMNGRAAFPAGITAAALMRKTLAAPRWAVPQVFPAGLTILAGSMKLGKSWIALQTALAVAQGGRALGEIPVEAGACLYLCLEDTEWRLQGRLALLLGESTAPEGLHLHMAWPRLEEGGRAALDAWLTSHPGARLVIIDTLGRFRSVPDPAINMYYSDSEASAAIKELADRHGVSVIVIHHTSKRKVEDVFESISGSNGLGAAADGMIVLERKRTEETAKLHLVGRDVEGRQMAIEWEAHAGWAFRGNAADFLRTKTEERVFAVFVMVEGRPLPTKEIAGYLEQTENTTRVQLWRMQQKGLLLSVDRAWMPANPNFVAQQAINQGNDVMAVMAETAVHV